MDCSLPENRTFGRPEVVLGDNGAGYQKTGLLRSKRYSPVQNGTVSFNGTASFKTVQSLSKRYSPVQNGTVSFNKPYCPVQNGTVSFIKWYCPFQNDTVPFKMVLSRSLNCPVQFKTGRMVTLGKTATKTQEMLVKVYDVEAVSKKGAFEWFKCFRDGKEDVEDEPRSGRPPTSTTPDNIEGVRRTLAED
ncbi:hypothetical protein AVEN_16855-1 [Araneus ventricosus]|uniref:Mos1 transposase HTH domain-containing protein n=1 Tax=Araneus ventricosus TaxID=182803 RepID=A0A4Y2KX72_ARAVE|nr:hypothetical protein AVEN_16855-1 [Araneus ventricosus]